MESTTIPFTIDPRPRRVLTKEEHQDNDDDWATWGNSPVFKMVNELKKLIRNTFKTAAKNPFVQMVFNAAIQQIIMIAFQRAFTKQAKIADIKTPIPSSDVGVGVIGIPSPDVGVGVIGIPSPIGTTGWGIGDDGLPFDYSCGEWYEGLFYRSGKNNLSHPLCTIPKQQYTGSWELGEGAHPISSAAAPAPAPAPFVPRFSLW